MVWGVTEVRFRENSGRVLQKLWEASGVVRGGLHEGFARVLRAAPRRVPRHFRESAGRAWCCWGYRLRYLFPTSKYKSFDRPMCSTSVPPWQLPASSSAATSVGLGQIQNSLGVNGRVDLRSCPIVPVMLGDARLASEIADEMLKRGIYATRLIRDSRDSHKANEQHFMKRIRLGLYEFGVRGALVLWCLVPQVIGFSFPVVPKGAARIRVQMSAAHEFLVRTSDFKTQSTCCFRLGATWRDMALRAVRQGRNRCSNASMPLWRLAKQKG